MSDLSTDRTPSLCGQASMPRGWPSLKRCPRQLRPQPVDLALELALDHLLLFGLLHQSPDLALQLQPPQPQLLVMATQLHQALCHRLALSLHPLHLYHQTLVLRHR